MHGDPANLSDGSDVESPGKVPKRGCMSVAQGSTTRNPETLSLSQSNTAVLEEHGARLERLERMLLANGSYGSPDISMTQQQRSSAEPLTSGLTVREGVRTRFFGQMSTRVLLNLVSIVSMGNGLGNALTDSKFDEAKEFMLSRNKPPDIRELFINIQKIHMTLQEENVKATTPIGVFVDSMTPVQKRMADILPRKAVCDQLVHVYIRGTETIFRMIHIPSFMQQYNMYWDGHAQPDVFLAQLLSILCVGYRFIGPGKGLAYDREGIHIPTACALVRTWLDGLRGKQLAEFSTLQCEILQLCAQRMINPQNQESWTHLGLIVRMAMTMGLHRDPSEFAQKMSPFWAELRRRIWYTILEFDIQMSTQCNLPCSIRHGDFTCRPPRNLNDEDLWPDMAELPEPKPIEQDTDCRIQTFAASTMAARFRVADLLNRIDSLRDYDQVLELGKELERAFDEPHCIVIAAVLALELQRAIRLDRGCMCGGLEIGTDTKDLIALTVVLSTCVGGTQDQKRERIKRGLQAILEAGLQAVHINQENFASMPPSYPLNTPPINSAAMNQSPFVMSPDVSDMTPDDLSTWETDFWTPLFS
ncbi:putative zn2cys6 transcription factor protein [Eutypa lata UCREL1]|uniref:Putative zn2cys6 transcription factor protein n=1 Tax=Eutypa lata (strain UCR-EL1) TaxID=1287681 RepID=M7SMY1_EUTLA|nr:putative zn2cys6 transcription factor protein [Eutypa lata UCREL1]